MKRDAVNEPDFAQACQWWPDLENIWTPIGWQDHLFRFNVLWNGTLLAEPHLNRRGKDYAGQGVQVTFSPHYTEWCGTGRSPSLPQDDGSMRQGWNESAAPVLWTEWAKDGLLLRQEVFAHIPGGGEVATGAEPLFAWVRLSIYDQCPALPLEERHGFILLVDATHLHCGMSRRHNIVATNEKADYPRALHPDRKAYTKNAGFRILEPDDRVRLGVAPGAECQGTWFAPGKDQPWNKLYLSLPGVKGSQVDVLIPMLPTDRKVFDTELALGYAGALGEAEARWAQITAGGARFEVPEPEITAAVKHSVRFSCVLTEKNPATGKYCKVNGSWAYADLWTTPGTMDTVMLMDTLGYHQLIARYLEIFREEQGTVVPPGEAFKLHPGYLSTPALYKSIDWLSDNGALLYNLASHALLSGDADFAARYTDCIVKSCEWIRDSRALKDHGGFEGVLPPAVATDMGSKIQAVWSVGWNYKGLVTAVRLLRQLGHPRAAEFAAEAQAYREAFLKALRQKISQLPTWQDAAGQTQPFVPTALAAENKLETRHAFYLDTGPLFLVFADLIAADDPLMEAVRKWFREGPARAHYRPDGGCWQVPQLRYEMSSCEPCYSWNVFHSHQLGDRQHFLEGMYSLFAGALSRKTYISCETRGGITGNVFASALAVYMARLAVIDDQVNNDELHLLRLMPLAWVKPGDRCCFENVPTAFGPVSLRVRCSKGGKRLEVRFKPQFRAKPGRVVLHVPPAPWLKRVLINDRKEVSAKAETVEL